jgi:hypothetical protein
MYHGPKSRIKSKTFCLPFFVELFLFLHFRLSNTIQECLERRKKAIVYYNNLEMEGKRTVVHKHYLKINSSESLVLLGEILGNGVG